MAEDQNSYRKKLKKQRVLGGKKAICLLTCEKDAYLQLIMRDAN